MPKILYRGAESIIYLHDGGIVKERIKKSYRIPQIDEKLRRERTRKEVKLLVDSRALNVMTPKILGIADDKIVMEHVKGKTLKQMLDRSNAPAICRRVGEMIGRLHNSNIVHGDLTTSNMLIKGGLLNKSENIPYLKQLGWNKSRFRASPDTYSTKLIKGKDIYFIDFSLGDASKKLEDKGVDMKVLKESIQATHSKIFKTCWDNIVKGYKSEYGDAEKVMEKVNEIERRARYRE